MPELPEVEIIRRGITPFLTGQEVTAVVVRERRLRWPITPEFENNLVGQIIRTVERRAKYLLLRTISGSVMLHLGMSGTVRVLTRVVPAQKHDHVDLILANGYCLRFTDPRRFGSLQWIADPPENHPLLRHLGPEPLQDHFTGEYLYDMARGRKVPIKSYIMDNHVVVGVGNIYANEALFMSGIWPLRAAGRISLNRYQILTEAVRLVLTEAIAQGGTTLRDFLGGQGEPGYFQQYLRVYGRAQLPCVNCGGTIRLIKLGQRATYFCVRCQR